MALKKTFVLPSGQVFRDAYIRIETIAGDKNVAVAVVNVYADEATATEAQWPIQPLHSRFEFPRDHSRPAWEQAYSHALTLPEYEGAVPA